MIQTGTRPIYQEIEQSTKLQSRAKSLETKLALANYITDMYEVLYCMGDEPRFPKYAAFGSREHKEKIDSLLQSYRRLQLDNFLEHKDFHHHMFGEIVTDVQELIVPLFGGEEPRERAFSDVEFYNILYSFLGEYGLDSQFRSLDKNGKMLSFYQSQKSMDGLTSFNPATGETFLFVAKENSFDYTTMVTLIHEFGHGYDLGEMGTNPLAFNQYYYLSPYSEVFPRTLERLFLRYCAQNGIRGGSSREKFLDFASFNFDYLLWGYVLCKLEDNFFRKHKDLNFQIDKIVRKVGSSFNDAEALSESLHSCPDFNIRDIVRYTYGDIVSIFLADDIEKFGMKSDLLEYFMRGRIGVFQERFLEEMGIDPTSYMEHYEKEYQYIKK